MRLYIILSIIVEADASPWGVDAVISHQLENGDVKPISFASRTLTATEKNYAQLDKEALGIIFAIKKFHKYLFGRQFTIYTDHKPLTRILHATKEIPTLAAARLQRWALILSSYNYDIKYKPSKDNLAADALSRLPLMETSKEEEDVKHVTGNLNHLDEFPYSYEEIAVETERDPELRKVLNYLRNGWPHKKDEAIKNFNLKMNQLSIENGCILWGLRVVIPSVLRPKTLMELHRCHLGVVRMKLLARSILWWPKIDTDIEELVLRCEPCQLHARDPPKTELHPWIRPEGPWQRVHVDLMGPVLGKMILVLVDAYSKWPEVKVLKSTTSETIMLTLEEFYTRYGYPTQLVTDNGAPFTSELFETYLKNRGIYHIKSPPYHPSSNGQAERFVEIVKNHLEKLNRLDPIALHVRINELLFSYRSTPHSTLKYTPSELFLGRTLRTRLQKVNPLPQLPRISFKRKYHEDQEVLCRMYSKKSKEKWMRGTIVRILGPVTFLIKLEDGRIGKRHFDQIKPSALGRVMSPKPMGQPQATEEEEDWSHITPETIANQYHRRNVLPPPLNLDEPDQPLLRYSTRVRRPPDKLSYHHLPEGRSELWYI